jgi:hypothetical protein
MARRPWNFRFLWSLAKKDKMNRSVLHESWPSLTVLGLFTFLILMKMKKMISVGCGKFSEYRLLRTLQQNVSKLMQRFEMSLSSFLLFYLCATFSSTTFF